MNNNNNNNNNNNDNNNNNKYDNIEEEEPSLQSCKRFRVSAPPTEPSWLQGTPFEEFENCDCSWPLSDVWPGSAH